MKGDDWVRLEGAIDEVTLKLLGLPLEERVYSVRRIPSAVWSNSPSIADFRRRNSSGSSPRFAKLNATRKTATMRSLISTNGQRRVSGGTSVKSSWNCRDGSPIGRCFARESGNGRIRRNVITVARITDAVESTRSPRSAARVANASPIPVNKDPKDWDKDRQRDVCGRAHRRHGRQRWFGHGTINGARSHCFGSISIVAVIPITSRTSVGMLSIATYRYALR